MTTATGHILVVEDDHTVRDVVSRYLVRAGYQVSVAGDGERGMQLACGAKRPDLVVLDLMLPGHSGLVVCAELRARPDTRFLPIIMLTALGEEEDRVLGLELGADDYITKPFSPRELVLRVSSVLRRAGDEARQPRVAPVVDGDLVVDVTARRAVLAGTELALTVREFDLLAFLVRNPGQAFSRAELLEKVWDWSFGDQSTVTVHVRRLREKVERDPTEPKRVSTVWGVGYRYDRADSGDGSAEISPVAG